MATLDLVIHPLALVAVAVWEDMQAPAPAMLLLEVALIAAPIGILGFALPATGNIPIECHAPAAPTVISGIRVLLDSSLQKHDIQGCLGPLACTNRASHALLWTPLETEAAKSQDWLLERTHAPSPRPSRLRTACHWLERPCPGHGACPGASSLCRHRRWSRCAGPFHAACHPASRPAHAVLVRRMHILGLVA